MTQTNSEMLALANTFVEKNKNKSEIKYKPIAHFSAPYGWLNDPNGLVYYHGYYHMFYQYNPYDETWGAPYWGHARSKNLIDWEDLPIALAPDQPYDISGVFSGSAIVKNDRLYIMYTGHVENEGVWVETQNIAFSDDGVNFTKFENNPVIDWKMLPDHASIADFRDPKLVLHGDTYYSILASTNPMLCKGQILVYESRDLLNWSFKSVLLDQKPELGRIAECPDLFVLGDKDALIFSVINEESDETIPNNLSFIALGRMNWQQGRFIPESIEKIDQSLDFYAPQTIDFAGQRVLIPWLRSNTQLKFLHDIHAGWNGQMGHPRVLELNDNWLNQRPLLAEHQVVNTEQLARDDSKVFAGVALINLEVTLQAGAVISLSSATDRVELKVVEDQLTVTFNFEKTNTTQYLPIGNFINQACHLTLLIDNSSFEVYVNQQVVGSYIIFPSEQITKITNISQKEMSIQLTSASSGE
ncbi:glycoside hydrolase family 32 protein [Lapidilactobacillus bayanensis]|uniref:glycoside hydrolase family 32 protein n=1 Tax=Lapidilactobacillus bayanensis TaxID=2485998 RepID=UPI000F774020|nr:glycoside hydrolase family 32 protein [Lapidilactobacillus bayanensis]